MKSCKHYERILPTREEQDKTDQSIALEITKALQSNWQVPVDKVSVTVINGCVILLGELQWNYQKAAAGRIIGHLQAVRKLDNEIVTRSTATDRTAQMQVQRALERNWTIQHKNIDVTVCGNCVTLTGTVTSAYQHQEAATIALTIPGILSVDNKLVVNFPGD